MMGSNQRVPAWRKMLPWGLGIFSAWALCGALGLVVLPWAKFPNSEYVLEQVGWRFVGMLGFFGGLLGVFWLFQWGLSRWWRAPKLLVVALSAFVVFMTSVFFFALDVVQGQLPGYRGHQFLSPHQVTILSYGPWTPVVAELADIISIYEGADLEMGRELEELQPEKLLAESTLIDPKVRGLKRQKIVALLGTLKTDRVKVIGMLDQWEKRIKTPKTDVVEIAVFNQKIQPHYHCFKRSLHGYFRVMDTFLSQVLLVYDTMAALPTGEVSYEGNGLIFNSDVTLQRFKTQMGAFTGISKDLSKTSQESRGALLNLKKSIEELSDTSTIGVGS